MILKVIAVYDAAVAAFYPPTFVQAAGLAVRSFGDEVRKEDTPFNAHPEDYELYCVGEFDTDTGALIPLPNPERLARGIEYKSAL